MCMVYLRFVSSRPVLTEKKNDIQRTTGLDTINGVFHIVSADRSFDGRYHKSIKGDLIFCFFFFCRMAKKRDAVDRRSSSEKSHVMQVRDDASFNGFHCFETPMEQQLCGLWKMVIGCRDVCRLEIES